MKAAPVKLISVLVPYVAVLLGLYIFENAWIAILVYHVGIAAFLIAGDRKALLRRIYTGWNSPLAALGVVLPAMIVPILLLLWQYMQLEATPLDFVLARFGLRGIPWLLFVAYFSTVQPFLEELYWRGHLQGDRRCVSWTDFAFGGYHVLVLAWFIKLPWLAPAFLVLAGTAFVWRHWTSKLGGLAVPLLSHAVADISIMVATCVLMQ